MGFSLVEKAGGFAEVLADAGLATPLTSVNDLLAEQGVRGYLVGGFVRDVLLGRQTIDVDIAVAADALEVARKVAGVLRGKYVPLDEVNRMARVVPVGGKQSHDETGWQFDFSSFEGDIEQDLARRDFTIDAMAVSLDEVLTAQRGVPLTDPFDGQTDLDRGLVRSLSESAFQADPARLLRAVRLAAELGFSIEEATGDQIRRHAHLVATVAGERAREELLRLLGIPGGGRFLTCLDRLGLLTAIVPELAAARGFEQPREHFWDVLDHSLWTVIAVESLLRRSEWEHADGDLLSAVPWSPELAAHFNREVSPGSTAGLLLKLAALLHDVAKPHTRTVESGGRMRFLGHAQQGASVAAAALERLRFSAREVRLVEAVVRYHLRPTQMSHEGLPSRRAIYRYFRDAGDAGVDTLFLSLADHLASRGPHLNPAGWREHTRVVDFVLAQHSEEEREPRPVKLVDGHDLMDVFGLSPGPRLGQLLEEVREAQAVGEVTTREEALELVRDSLSSEEKG